MLYKGWGSRMWRGALRFPRVRVSELWSSWVEVGVSGVERIDLDPVVDAYFMGRGSTKREIEQVMLPGFSRSR